MTIDEIYKAVYGHVETVQVCRYNGETVMETKVVIPDAVAMNCGTFKDICRERLLSGTGAADYYSPDAPKLFGLPVLFDDNAEDGAVRAVLYI